ncbi:MAG: hypothetical protein M3O91_07365 [Chloroflexota bacterium]|nr:hypothetical protein [Chloroflexota bacterium]
MEVLIAIGALVLLDVLAVNFGFDSRERHADTRHAQALDALRRGDVATYRDEISKMEDALHAPSTGASRASGMLTIPRARG